MDKQVKFESLRVPSALCGPWVEVKPKCMKLCRRVVKTMFRSDALTGEEWIDAREIPGDFIIRGPMPGLGKQDPGFSSPCIAACAT